MNIYEIIIIGFCLAMDAFSVSVYKGMTFDNGYFTNVSIVALYFAIFQLLMTYSGYLLGTSFSYIISSLDHWVAFILLFIIGIQMIIKKKKNNNYSNSVKFSEMIFLSIATSIDALTIGITLSFFNVPIFLYSFIIGLITFFVCFFGGYIGKVLGNRFSYISNYIGGSILIYMAFKILFEHMHFLIFI